MEDIGTPGSLLLTIQVLMNVGILLLNRTTVTRKPTHIKFDRIWAWQALELHSIARGESHHGLGKM